MSLLWFVGVKMNALELVLGTWEPLNLVDFYFFGCVQSYALQHML